MAEPRRSRPIEAEVATLGACLLDNGVIPLVREHVRESDFTDERHRLVWRATLALSAEGEPADEVSVLAWLARNGEAKKITPLYVGELVERTPTSVNAERYASEVRQAAGVRALYRAAQQAMKQLEDGIDAIEVRQALAEAATEIDQREPEKFVDVVDDLLALMREMEQRAERGVAVSPDSFVSTGYPMLDDTLVGFGAGQLIVIAADSGVGKTALALNFASRQACAGRAIGFFSGEMTRQAIARRLLACTAPTNHHVLRAGLLADTEWPRVVHALGKIERKRFLINDTVRTIQQVCGLATRASMRQRLDTIYVDYLQRLVPRSDRRDETREQVIAQAAVDLKNLAKALGTAVVVLSQVNQDGSARESKAIFHEADVFLMLRRPGSRPDSDTDPRESEIEIQKQRDGSVGRVQLDYVKQFLRFEEPAMAPPRITASDARTSWIPED